MDIQVRYPRKNAELLHRIRLAIHVQRLRERLLVGSKCVYRRLRSKERFARDRLPRDCILDRGAMFCERLVVAEEHLLIFSLDGFPELSAFFAFNICCSAAVMSMGSVFR